jgi:Protein of unknown function (DUF1353)
MNRFCRLIAAPLASAVWLVSCTTTPYDPELAGGDFTGEIILGWDDGIRFIYYPSDRYPLTYSFPEGHPLKTSFGPIKPEAMYTDGGSIPRILWSVHGLSAWEYAPAYILHDWLFQRHYCFKDDFKITLEQANAVFRDALVLTDLKLAENNKRAPQNRAQIRALIDGAVRSFSKTAWDTGICPPAVEKKPFRTVMVRAEGGERIKLKSGRRVTLRAGQTYPKQIANFTEITRIRVGEGL